MNLIKIVMYVVDFDNIGANDIKTIIDNNRYIHLFRFNSVVKDIGDWDDNHKLNLKDTSIKEFEEYFKEWYEK